MKSILSKIFFALVCILIACVVEFVFNWAQDTFDTYFKFDTVIESLLMLFLTEYITNWLSKKFPAVLPLPEAVGGIWQLICDAKLLQSHMWTVPFHIRKFFYRRILLELLF